MSQLIRAIYSGGQLKLLEPVDLTEGQEIQLMILSERERAYAALEDILVHYDPETAFEEMIDEAALLAEIEADTRGKPAISDAIIEERQEGP